MTSKTAAHLNLAPPTPLVEKLDGGGFLLSNTRPLMAYPASVTEHLVSWARKTPDNVFLAERDSSGGWLKVDYKTALAEVRKVAQGLLNLELDGARPVMILSDNSVESGLLTLAALHVGIPVAPISPAYSLVSQDHSKLRHAFNVVKPGLIYAADGKRFERAFGALELGSTKVCVGANLPESLTALLFRDIAAEPTEAVDRAAASVTPDTIAKILFTSGSTGLPKGVINTQRMLCSNQQAMAQAWPFLDDRPPVILDWLPWNHTFGGNHNFNMILRAGGSLYIDQGKPLPGAIGKTVANLGEVSPTLYFNVPKGFDVLLPYLEADEELSRNFFRNLDMIFYAAAALPQPLWERLEKLSLKATGKKVTMLSGWGATETSPVNTLVHWSIDRAGVIGLPVSGTCIKMIPSGGKLEMRLKGPNVTPGYYGDEAQTKAAFDEEGYYLIGDAGKFVDESDPSRGIAFDGRVSEDFKLTTGTWVHVGGLRIAAIEAAGGLLQDCVITGHNRDYLAVMAWPNLEACRALIKDQDADEASVASDPGVVEALKAGFARMNGASKGSSTRINRLILLLEPPNLDANEITDKGYINQRATLERRAALVEELYAEPPSARVLVF